MSSSIGRIGGTKLPSDVTQEVIWNPGLCPPGSWLKLPTEQVIFIQAYKHPDPAEMGFHFTADIIVYSKYPETEEETLNTGQAAMNVAVTTYKKDGTPYIVTLLPKPPGSEKLEAGMGMRSTTPIIPTTVEEPTPLSASSEGAVPKQCSQHPNYRGKRRSRTGCPMCEAIYAREEAHRQHIAKELALVTPTTEPLPQPSTSPLPGQLPLPDEPEQAGEDDDSILPTPMLQGPQRPTVDKAGEYVVPIVLADGTTGEVALIELLDSLGRVLEGLHSRLWTLEDNNALPTTED